MARDELDYLTLDAFGGPAKQRGRPKTGLAKSPAERKRLARAKKALEARQRASWAATAAKFAPSDR